MEHRDTPLQRAGKYAFAIVTVVCAMLPFLLVLLTSVKNDTQIRNVSEIIPSTITFDNYVHVLLKTSFLTYFWNSVRISLITTVVCLVLSVMAAYGLTRYKIFGAQKIKLGVLYTRMFPPVLLSIPYYVIMRNIGLIDSHMGLIFMYLSFTLPFAMWNICSFFNQIPWDLEEAAFMDGCNRFSSFMRVILPVARPGIFATSLYCFLLSWDEFMYANTFINSSVKKTIQVGIRDFIGEYSTEWGNLMSAVVLSLIPILLFFSLVQKNLVGGLTSGSVKG